MQSAYTTSKALHEITRHFRWTDRSDERQVMTKCFRFDACINLHPINVIQKSKVKITAFYWFDFVHTFLTLLPSSDVCIS